MSDASQQRMPEPAHDPIAIAALIAALPEFEAKFAVAMKIAEAANKELDMIQDRIDQALNALRNKAPRGSKWNTEPLYSQTQGLYLNGAGNKALNRMLDNQALLAKQIQRYEEQKIDHAFIAPPPPTMPIHAIKELGPWG